MFFFFLDSGFALWPLFGKSFRLLFSFRLLADLVSYGYSIEDMNGRPMTAENGELRKLGNGETNAEVDIVLTHHGVLNQFRAGTIKF